MDSREAMWRFGAAAMLLAAACALPAAHAASSIGDLTVASLTLPAGAESTVAFLGLVHNDAKNLSGSLQAKEITLCKYEARYAEVSNGEPLLRLPMNVDVQEACFPLTNAILTLTPKAGWVGLRPYAGGTASLTTWGPADVTPEDRSTLASMGYRLAGSEDDDRKPRFHEVVTGSHLLYAAPAHIVYGGDGEIRIMGPTAHVKAAENSTTHKTGDETRGGTSAVHERIARWIVVRYDAATLTLDAPTPFLLAARNAPHLAWDGNLTAASVRGYVNAQGTMYAPEREGEPASLEGAFTATLTPSAEGNAARLQMEGVLRETTLRPKNAPVPVPAGSSWPPWLLVVGAAVLLASTGAAIGTASFLRRRQRRRIEALVAPYTLEDCRGAAAHYLDTAEYDRALPWLENARLLAPKSGRFAVDMAFCLERLGRLDEALAAYAEADRLSPANGDPAMHAARILRKVQGPPEEAYRWLRIALAKSPEYVVDLREEFPEVLTDPRWEEAIEKAHGRLEEGWK